MEQTNATSTGVFERIADEFKRLKTTFHPAHFRQSQSAQFLAYFLIVIALFIVSKLFLLDSVKPGYLLIYYTAMLAVALSACRWKMTDAPLAFQTVLRGSLLVFTFYTATYYYSLPVDNAVIGIFVEPLRWLTVALGVLAWFRPSFAIVLFTYALWFKKLAIHQSGYNISPTDFTAVLEIGYFLTLGFLVYNILSIRCAAFSKLREGFPILANTGDKNNVGFPVLNVFLYFAITIHFSNYFFSGLEKVILGQSLTTWIFENRTEYLVLTAREYGILPISKLLTAFPNLYPIIGQTTPLINAISLFSQLLAIVAIFRVRWMILLTLLFDLFHVAIFILCGIFFWKWVILNLSIVLALRQLRQERVPVRVALAGGVCMLLAPTVFFIARLGWFDTRAPIVAYVEAKTSSGVLLRVPSNYYLMPSITFAQSRVARPLKGHFPTGGFGIAKGYGLMKRANACQLNVQEHPSISDQAFEKLARFLKRHHQFIMSHLDSQGRYNYDLYPHHIWSNPLEYQRFYALDKRQITGYRLVVESLCLDYKDGKFLKDIRYRSTREFDL